MRRKSAKLDFRDEVDYFQPAPLSPVMEFQTLNSSPDLIDSLDVSDSDLDRQILKAKSAKKKGKEYSYLAFNSLFSSDIPVTYPRPPPVFYSKKAPKPHDVQLKSVVIPKRPQKPETPIDISKILSVPHHRRSTSRQERDVARALDLELELIG